MNKRLVAVLCMLAIFVAPQPGCRQDIKELLKECHSNEDCKENEICGSNGKCSEMGCPNGTVLTDSGACCKPDSECLKDSDCPVRPIGGKCINCKCGVEPQYSEK